MASMYRVLKDVGKQALLRPKSRSLHNATVKQDVKIVERKEGNDLIIEGIKLDSSKDPLMLKNDTGACPLCALNLDLKHTDVLILKQFVRPDGCMLPKRITGLCLIQQRRVGSMVTMAQKAGLMPNLVPGPKPVDPSKRRNEKKFHTYYDEDTIIYRFR